MWTGTKILVKSAKYSIILTIINVIISLVVSLIFTGGIETSQITGNLGNITLLESVCLFLAAPVTLYNTATRRDSYRSDGSAEGDENKEDEDYTIARVPNGRGGWFVGLIGRRRAVPNEGDRGNVGKALTFVLCGAILFVETVALAFMSSFNK